MWLSLVSLIGFIDEMGFNLRPWISESLHWLYFTSIVAGLVSLVFRYWIRSGRPPRKVWLYDSILFIGLCLVLLNLTTWLRLPFFDTTRYLFIGVLFVFFREFSTLNVQLTRKFLNPAQVFILSFLLLIFLGSLMLLLPNATHEGITYLDALFTSTSAVCVTGLIVVDTGTYFTQFGQSIILVLIQLGGLGIMTFTSYFSYFFTGAASYESQILLREMTNSEKLAEVFGTLKKILFLTFGIELAGALLIFFSISPDLVPQRNGRVFFSTFHAVSAFCNAGFSTLTDSLYDAEFKFNYSMQLIIAFLFIFGGIGFPILFNFIRYVRHFLVKRIFYFGKRVDHKYQPWLININSRIVLITTVILLAGGTLLFLWLEYDNTLKEHSLFGKIVTAFFGAATPRTAGFNSVNMAALRFPTIMLTFLLMWIGASPGSTGGGIKTSTLAIATLNFFSLARGKNRVEVFKREISNFSIQKAFAIISLSVIVIGVAISMISLFDSNKSLLAIGFESFSAYSTVGLSLGITADLSSASKMVIILTMFIGRVSMLTILIALLRRVKHQNYQYPKEDILIN